MSTEVRREKALKTFKRTLKQAAEAPSIAKKQHITRLLSTIEVILDSDEGTSRIYPFIHEITATGLFKDSPWENPEKLFPALVSGTLMGGQQNAIMEVLSELRVLAIAEDQIKHPGFDTGAAVEYLQVVIAQNLDLAFPKAIEQQREVDKVMVKRARRLFHFIMERIPLEGIKAKLAEEIEDICAQRPIATQPVREMINLIKNKLQLDPTRKTDRRISLFVKAIHEPTALSAENQDPEEYLKILSTLGDKRILEECLQLGKSLHKTGLASIYHAQMLRFLTPENPVWSSYTMNLDGSGKAELRKHKEFVKVLIEQAIRPATCQSVYGLARLLERGLLSRQPVMNGLRKILVLKINEEVCQNIRKTHQSPKSLKCNEILLADTLSVLGQPLGIGQGWNPTCQAARGISLWSQHAPGKLLNMIIDAAKYNRLEFRFEGDILDSTLLALGLAKKLDFNLDSVSVVLVPHLDRVYNEMMRRAAMRDDDPHKWANPGLYGHWIPVGFASAYDHRWNAIVKYEEFVRLFYATQHPEYNEGHDLVYPNPVGIFITAPNGSFLGFHAISLLRISKDPSGVMRIYFLNPNNEGRQKWADDMRPSVRGNGERYGESSLPFHQLASRIYAFHYNPVEVGDLSLVDGEEVNRVIELARNSWGKAYQWIEETGLTP